MNTIDDIDRLRGAEKEAQAFVAEAKAKAQQVRKDTETRVVELGAGAGEALSAMRERVQAETTGETEAFVSASHARVAATTKDVAAKLAAGKESAVQAVVEAVINGE